MTMHGALMMLISNLSQVNWDMHRHIIRGLPAILGLPSTASRRPFTLSQPEDGQTGATLSLPFKPTQQTCHLTVASHLHISLTNPVALRANRAAAFIALDTLPPANTTCHHGNKRLLSEQLTLHPMGHHKVCQDPPKLANCSTPSDALHRSEKLLVLGTGFEHVTLALLKPRSTN